MGIEQWCFDYFWLYGLVEPMTGETFFYEFCHLDSICFEKYLELFARQFPDDFHIIQLDNSPLHQAFDLAIEKIFDKLTRQQIVSLTKVTEAV